jgi:hypothetical protein
VVKNTGNGAEDQGTKGSHVMAESSESSTPKGKKPTSRMSKLTQEQALEIVQQSILEYQKAGGEVTVVPQLFYSGHQALAIVMPGAHLVNGNLTLSTGKPEGMGHA